MLAWCDEVKKAKWKIPADIKAQYARVRILKNRRVVFNLKGNDFRLLVAVAYNSGFFYVKFIGTHKEYDQIGANTVGLFFKGANMEIRPIRTKADYQATLKRVSALVDADPKRGTPKGNRLEILGTLIASYEAKHYATGG